MRVLKCRHTGDTGVAGKLRYYRDTGRLKECADAFGFSEDLAQVAVESDV